MDFSPPEWKQHELKPGVDHPSQIGLLLLPNRLQGQTVLSAFSFSKICFPFSFQTQSSKSACVGFVILSAQLEGRSTCHFMLSLALRLIDGDMDKGNPVLKCGSTPVMVNCDVWSLLISMINKTDASQHKAKRTGGVLPLLWIILSSKMEQMSAGHLRVHNFVSLYRPMETLR